MRRIRIGIPADSSSADIMTAEIHCSTCSWPLPSTSWMSDRSVRCPHCHSAVEVHVFPALLQAKVNEFPEKLAAETEASCFYHADNRAVKPCDQCGRFLCGLCQLEIPGQTLCPVCFDSNLRGRKMQDLENSRTMHDSIALTIATAPALLVWPALISAPIALYWTIRHWNSPRSIVPRTRVRFYLAAILALSELVLFALLILAILKVQR